MHPVVHLDCNTAFLDAIHGFLHYNCLLIIASYPSISWKPFSRFSRRNNNFKFSKRRIFSPPPMLEEIQLQFVSFINRHPEFCGQSDFFNLRGNKGHQCYQRYYNTLLFILSWPSRVVFWKQSLSDKSLEISMLDLIKDIVTITGCIVPFSSLKQVSSKNLTCAVSIAEFTLNTAISGALIIDSISISHLSSNLYSIFGSCWLQVPQ